MKILFVSHTDPQDKKAFSGTIHSMYKALQSYHEVEWIGAFHYTLFQKCYLLILKLVSKLRGFNFPQYNSKFLREAYAKAMNNRLKNIDYDIVFAPMASSLIANLEITKDIIYLSDATFKPMLNYYLFNIPQYYIDQGNYNESKALIKASKVILCSSWAKKTTIDSYDVNDEKIEVVELGPNFEKIPLRDELNFNVVEKDKLQLAFVGVDWKRKGGDIAYSCFKQLKDWNIECKLVIVGCKPPFKIDDDDVTIYPSLNKNNKVQFDKLYQIYLESSFLIVPSRAECYGLVFCEASAFGIPCIATNTGGISSIIKDGVNGYMFSLSSKAEQYAEKIKELWMDKKGYNNLKKTTRDEYENNLTWDIWINKINNVLYALNSKD